MSGVLFVTVDPDRDTPAVLKHYVDAFSPQIDGLRGSDNQLADAGAALSRRLFASTPKPALYDVMHSNAVFFFDRDGRAGWSPPTRDATSDGDRRRCEAPAQICSAAPVGGQHRFVHHLRQRRMREDGVRQFLVGQLAGLGDRHSPGSVR